MERPKFKEISFADAVVPPDAKNGTADCVIQAFCDALDKAGLFAAWGKILNERGDMSGFHVTIHEVLGDDE